MYRRFDSSKGCIDGGPLRGEATTGEITIPVSGTRNETRKALMFIANPLYTKKYNYQDTAIVILDRAVEDKSSVRNLPSWDEVDRLVARSSKVTAFGYGTSVHDRHAANERLWLRYVTTDVVRASKNDFP